jgi:hypothetical protein
VIVQKEFLSVIFVTNFTSKVLPQVVDDSYVFFERGNRTPPAGTSTTYLCHGLIIDDYFVVTHVQRDGRRDTT